MADDKIIIKRSGIPGDIPLPSQLEFGELALNYADGRLFAKTAAGTISDLSGLPASNNTIYVSVEGNDVLSGREPGEAKRTIRAALNSIGPGNTVVVAAGTYVEETPLIMPQGTTIHGVDQRITTVRPNTATNDIFWVSSGCYIAGLAFRGHMKPSFAIAFPGIVHSGTAQSGSTSTTIVLDSTKAVQGVGLEDYYREMRVVISAGTGAGQSRNIVSYDITTQTATVDAAWTTIPTNGSDYYIDIPIPASPSLSTRYSTHIIASPYLYNMASVTADQFLSTSASSIEIGDGITGSSTATFIITPGLTIATGRWIRAAYDAQNYLTGTVNSYNSTNGELVLDIAKSVRTSQMARNFWKISYICGSGMEIDGYKAAGLRSMVSAQFTQFNSGGDGVVIRNMGYAQLVSIYAICCEDGFLAESGGTSSMGNCNVNFGTYGLVARDVGPLLMSGRAGFVYDKTRCQRDTRLIVDAVVQDLQNEGLTQSVFAGIQYWNQDSVVATSTSSNVLGTGSKTFTIQTNLSSLGAGTYIRIIHDELNYMYGQVSSYNASTGELIVNVTRFGEYADGRTLSSWEILGPGDNTIPDDQRNATSAAIRFMGDDIQARTTIPVDERNFLENACDKIADIIDFGTADLTNQIKRNSVEITSDADAVSANSIVQAAKGDVSTSGSIIKNVIDYLSTTFPSLTFSTTKCARDLGYILDCICFDMMYNYTPGSYTVTSTGPSNRQTIQAGVYYYGYTSQSALNDEKEQTVSAFNYLKANVAARLPTSANAHIRSLVNTKIDVVNDLITYGPTGEAKFTGTISSNILNVTSVTANSIRVGMAFTDNANGAIVSQITGLRGGVGNYSITITQTISTPKLFTADYTTPISFSRNTNSGLVTAGHTLDSQRTAIAVNTTNYIDTTLTNQGFANQIGFFINVSNIVTNTDPRFAITSNTKPYVGLVMYVEGEKTIDIQPGPGYNPGESIRLKDRANPTANTIDATVTAFDLATGAATLTVTSKAGTGVIQFWDTDRVSSPSKKGRFTQEINVASVSVGTLLINSIDTSKEINKYRTVVASNTVGDITFLELDERVPNNITLTNSTGGTTTFTDGIPKNAKVFFYQKSALSASGQTFEFIGSGTSVAEALPRNGGDIVQANEVVSSNGGVVYFTSTDQFGNFRIGEDLAINFNTGTLSGRTFTRSLFAQITPFILAIDS